MHMNNFWSKKYEKSGTDARKRKTVESKYPT